MYRKNTLKKSMNDQKTLEIHRLINENDIKDNRKEVWESCCIRTNPHAIVYRANHNISHNTCL